MIATCKKIEVDYFTKKAEHQLDSSADSLAEFIDETKDDSRFSSSDSDHVNVEQLKIVEDEDFNSMESTIDSSDEEDASSIDSNETIVGTTATSLKQMS